MTKKKKNKILILGKSKKFISAIKRYFYYKNIDIIPWRNIKLQSYKKNKYDYIFVCGFNFRIYNIEFNLFCKKNIYEPYDLIKLLAKTNTKVIYFNTQRMKKKFTFSRYNYAKQKLAYLINKNFKNSFIQNTDLIMVKNKVSVNSGFFSNYIFSLFAKFNLIKTVEIQKLIANIYYNKKIKNVKNFKNIKGHFLYLPRTQFIDRLIRLIFG